MKNKQRLKLAGSIAFYVLFTVVLLTVVMMMASRAKGEVFFIGNRAYIWVITGSMEDEIPANSYIRIRRESPENIKEGDVITFYSDDPMLGGGLNTHRVERVTETGFVTKGDNNPIEDKYEARRECVVGVYEKNAPLLSAVGRMFQSGVGIAVAVALVAIICFFTLFYDLIKPKKKGEQENK